MPGVQKRSAAEEGQRRAGLWGSYAQIVRALGDDNAHLDKRAALEFSDHCTPTPSVSVSSTTASHVSTWPTPAISETVATTSTPNSRSAAASYGGDTS